MFSNKPTQTAIPSNEYTPTIQYFIAVINNDTSRLNKLESEALRYLDSVKYENRNSADDYFFQLRSNQTIADNVSRGGSGGIHGLGGQFLDFYRMCALAYVKDLIATCSIENTAPKLE